MSAFFTTTDMLLKLVTGQPVAPARHTHDPEPGLGTERAYFAEYTDWQRKLNALDALEVLGQDAEYTDAIDRALARKDARLIGQIVIEALDLYAARLASKAVYGSYETAFRDRPNSPAQVVAMVFERATSEKNRRTA